LIFNKCRMLLHEWWFIQGDSLKWFQELVVTMEIFLLLYEGIYLKLKWFFLLTVTLWWNICIFVSAYYTYCLLVEIWAWLNMLLSCMGCNYSHNQQWNSLTHLSLWPKIYEQFTNRHLLLEFGGLNNVSKATSKQW
jgi:hypothetical protein